MKPFVTVIILSKQWTRDCEEVLAELSRQEYPSNLFEIVFVLDPSEEIQHAERESPLSQPRVRVVHSSTASGISSARNDGILEAKGTLVAFIDSDCRPNRDWLDRMVECIEKTGASIVGGQVVTDFVHYLPPIQTANINLGSSPLRASGANVIYRKSALVEIGGFDQVFKRGCDDYDLMLRLVEQGHRLAFCREASVVHQLDHFGVVGIWRLGADSYNAPLLFKKHPPWTRQWLGMMGRFTRQTMGLGFVLLSVLISACIYGQLRLPVAIVLPLLAFLAYTAAYAKLMLPRATKKSAVRLLKGSLAMLLYSFFALIWRTRGSIKHRAIVL